MAKLKLLPAFLSLWIIGCITWTHDIAYELDAARPGPLSRIPSLTVEVLEFKDDRVTDHQIIGHAINAATERPIQDYDTERPVPEIVKRAFETELMVNGHKLGSPTDSELRISGEITKFSLTTIPSIWTIKAISAIDLTVIVTETRTGEVLLKKTYRTLAENEFGSIATKADREGVVNQALQESVRKLSGDPALIKVLRAR